MMGFFSACTFFAAVALAAAVDGIPPVADGGRQVPTFPPRADGFMTVPPFEEPCPQGQMMMCADGKEEPMNSCYNNPSPFCYPVFTCEDETEQPKCVKGTGPQVEFCDFGERLTCRSGKKPYSSCLDKDVEGCVPVPMCYDSDGQPSDEKPKCVHGCGEGRILTCGKNKGEPVDSCAGKPIGCHSEYTCPKNGGEKATCGKAPACQPIVCPGIECKGGYLNDRNGCQTCDCIFGPEPTEEPTEYPPTADGSYYTPPPFEEPCPPGQKLMCMSNKKPPKDSCDQDTSPYCYPVFTCEDDGEEAQCVKGKGTQKEFCPFGARLTCETGTPYSSCFDQATEGCKPVPICEDGTNATCAHTCGKGRRLTCGKGISKGRPVDSCEGKPIGCHSKYTCPDNGNENAHCEDACPAIMCPKIFCPHGQLFDSEGCQTCECATCPIPKCRMMCKGGYALDKKGCQTCECATCPTPVCIGIACDHGYVNDTKGCQTCRCATCPIPKCRMMCKGGYVLDKKGCQTCECATCPTPICIGIACDHGYVLDKNGCETCECATCPTPLCPAIACDHGYVNDTKGCQTCECATCPTPICDILCEGGLAVDEKGCSKCECADRPGCGTKFLGMDGKCKKEAWCIKNKLKDTNVKCTCGESCSACKMSGDSTSPDIRCTKCKGGKYFANGMCLKNPSDCPAGTIPSGATDYDRACTQPFQCKSGKVATAGTLKGKKCSCPNKKYCQTCSYSEQSEGTCERCKGNFYLQKGTCEAVCDNDFFPVGHSAYGRSCQPKGADYVCKKKVGTDGAKCKCPKQCKTCTATEGGAVWKCDKCNGDRVADEKTGACYK